MRLKNCVFAGILLTASGCASQDVIVQRQTEMESRVEYLVQGNKALTLQLTQLSNELTELKDQVKNHSALIGELKESAAAAAAGTQAPAAQDGQTSPPQAPVTKIELINNDARAKEKSDTASASYMKAFGLYSADNYPAAIEAFNSFLKKYPNTEFAVNAQYWVGECYYSQSDLPKALEAFTKVVERYPMGKKVPDAMLKTGYTLYAMKEPQKARAMLLSLIEKFPENPAAVKARERLDSR